MSASGDFSISPRKRSQPQHEPADISEMFLDGSEFRLHVQESVLSDMRRHAADHPDEEVGGVLLGRHFEADKGYAVAVTDHLAVRSESRGQFHFDFDSSSIAMIFSRLDQGAEYVVGWYHSHTSGPPFMSELDHRLHRNHFRLPWYVSCVLGAGIWGVPADFWRMVDGELVSIDNYLLDVTSGGDATSAHQRFLRACQLEQSPEAVTGGYVARLLPSLGLAADGAIGRAARRSRAEIANVPGRLDELRLVTGLATALSADPAAVEEVGLLHQRLATTRAYDSALSLSLITNQFREQTALTRRRACSVTPGQSSLTWLDLRQKAYWPISLETPVYAASFAPDGTTWLLAQETQIVRLTLGSPPADAQGTPLFDCNIFRIRGVQGEPRQIIADDAGLWVRTTGAIYRLPIEAEPPQVRAGVEWEVPDADDHFLIAGLSATAFFPLLTRRGDKLQTWAVHGQDITEHGARVLSPPWAGWRLTHACVGTLGLYLIFDDGGDGQLGLFDPESLDLISHFVDDGDEEPRLSPTEVCADPFGQVYLRSGKILYRLRP